MPTLAERLPLSMQAAMVRATSRLPRRLRRWLAGKPIQLDGNTLALDAQLLLRLQRLSGTSLTTVNDAVKARQDVEDAARIMQLSGPMIDVATRDLTIPGPAGPIPARLYTPRGLASPSPLLVYYHGGGWCVGSVATHDQVVRYLAEHAGVRALSVDYRLAPEHPSPAAAEDALAAFDYAYKHADELGAEQDRIAVGGDSAGGNLSAVVSQLATRRSGPAPALQVLIYPATDFTVRRRSRELFADGYFLTDADMNWFESQYAPAGVDLTDPVRSPLLSPDLGGLPPAYITTAGFDPLRDEGNAYAAALAEAGVPVVLRCHDDLIHGFVSMLSAGARFREATLEIASGLRTGLALSRR